MTELSSLQSEITVLFADPATDLVLRSSDGILFPVESLYLKATSSVMKDLLSLPVSPSKRSEPIQLEEDAEALRLLLPFLLPRMKREKPTLSQIDTLLTLTDKYDAVLQREHLSTLLRTMAVSDSIEVFAIAATIDVR